MILMTEKVTTNIEQGLSQVEAKRRLQKNGPNRFEEKKATSVWELLWRQMNSMLIYILIAAAVISAIVGEVSDALIIGFVVVLNAIIGVIQEYRAERALDELKKISTPRAIVKRDGVIKEIPTEDVVVGDVVLLDAGRYVPADLELVETVQLQVEESSLTGESVPVAKDATWRSQEKNVPLGDQRHKAFMSTLVTYGRGVGIVTRTGMDTEIGKIARLLAHKSDEMTPLQNKLNQVGKVLGMGAIAISFSLFLIGFLQGREVTEMFLIAVSLAVAAIPEGLPAIVTIVLALGVQRMIKQHAVIRKLPAVETLGAVSVICSDKTGTLTQNKMTVTNVYTNDFIFKWSKLPPNNPTVERLMRAIILCNDATVKEGQQTGDPTEIALVEAAQQLGWSKQQCDTDHPRIHEIPFDSDRKMMSTVHKEEDQGIVYVKGALERLLPRLSHKEINGQVVPLTDADRLHIQEKAQHMSEQALRVLAVAYKQVDFSSVNPNQLERNLIFLGLTGMIDPPRDEVKESLATCHRAGIRVVMITGDHPHTALAIAKQLGIATHEDQTMTGVQLDAMSDTVLEEKITSVHVFARVSPAHKVRIVKAMKNRGEIVSMTGDGVNDAPSLQEADVGVAMGITGTDVAKGAADIVLTDDNFSTITAAVEEGRNIYKNIKKAILFLLSCNLGELFTLFIGILMGWPPPLTAVHILWVNLITDTMPAIALGVDSDDPHVMKEKPRPVTERIFTRDDVTFSVWNGVFIGVLTLFAFIQGLKQATGVESLLTMDVNLVTDRALIYAQTMAFLTLSISQLFHSFNVRSKTQSIFKVGLLTNKLLVGSVVGGIAIQVALVHIPLFSQFFGVEPLSWDGWLFVIGLSIVPVVINEVIKAGKRIFVS